MLAEIHNENLENYFIFEKQIKNSPIGGKFFLGDSISLNPSNIKVFTLDGEIKRILLSTKNKIGKRKIPFDSMFLDVNFYEDNYFCEGLVICNTSFVKDFSKNPPEEVEEYKKPYINFQLKTPIKENKEIMFPIKMHIPLNDKDFKWYMDKYLKISNDFVGKSINIDKREIKKLSIRIRNFVWNFIDFLNHPDIETKVVKWR